MDLSENIGEEEESVKYVESEEESDLSFTLQQLNKTLMEQNADDVFNQINGK